MTARQVDVNGWFEVKANPLSRVGVFPYLGRSLGMTGPDADRVFRVYRPEEELAAPECVESFKLLPWVDDHTMLGPDEEMGQTPAEQKGVQGVIGEDVFYDSGVLYGNIKAFSNSLARLIEAGKRQLSAGYRCVYEWASGTFNGQPYDVVQRKIRGNHLALVQEGRMGPSVAVLDHMTFSFDAQEAIPMADGQKDGAGEGSSGGGEMTLSEIAKIVGAIGPQLAKINEAMAALANPAATPAATPDAAPEADPAAATAAPPQADAVPAAMDAAIKPLRDTVEALSKTVAAMDAAIKGIPGTVVADVAARDKLADKLAAHFGTFDAADKTTSQVAAYGCEKAGLKPSAGSELVAIEAWLAGKGSPAAATVRHGMDAAPTGDNFVSRHLAGK